MAKQTLKDLRAIAKGHKIKYYYEMCKAKLIEILRDMGEEISDDEPTPKKCPHGRKKYLCKECDGDGICIHNRQKSFVKSVEVHKYVNIISKSMVVKSVRASIFNKKSIGGLGNMRKTIY